MDLDDLLEDLWEDTIRDTREKVRRSIERQRRMPGFRRRLRTAMLYGSAGWVATFTSLGIGTELAFENPAATAVALLFGGIALPGVGTGLWAWRGKRGADVHEREALARSRAKQERSTLPVDVVDDWVRLRRAQALVVDLAAEGLVESHAVEQTEQMVEELRVLLTADRRAVELGGTRSQPLRDQLGEVADLLVALAVEAVEHRTTEVGRGGAATLVAARDRLESLRAARAEVAVAEHGDAHAASAWIEREVAQRRAPAPDPGDERQAGPGPDEQRRQQPG